MHYRQYEISHTEINYILFIYTFTFRHLVQQQPAETNSYGPALPPHLLSRSSGSSTEESKYIGPALPPAPLQALHKESPPPSYYSSESDYNSNDDDDDMGVGPLPGVTNVALEQRALEIKLGKVSGSGDGSGANKEKAREEWMTELPQVKTVADLGLGARQFRTKERPDFSDRSSWTDTPHDRDKKSTKPPTEVDLKKQHEVELKKKLLKDRDKQQEKMAKELKKKHKRDKSLYELHQDKLNKAKKEKEDELQVRRPFDRNVDLQANRFDEAQKNAVIKKAQLLDSRFSSGSSKYL